MLLNRLFLLYIFSNLMIIFQFLSNHFTCKWASFVTFSNLKKILKRQSNENLELELKSVLSNLILRTCATWHPCLRLHHHHQNPNHRFPHQNLLIRNLSRSTRIGRARRESTLPIRSACADLNIRTFRYHSIGLITTSFNLNYPERTCRLK